MVLERSISLWKNNNNQILFDLEVCLCFLRITDTKKEVESDLNQLLFKFLWNGVDKVTRVSAINDYERGGLKLIDVDCMIRSLRLRWQQRVFNDSSATWKK